MVRQVLRYASLSLKIKQAICLPDGTTAEVADNTSTSSPPDGAVTTLHIRQTVNPGGFDSEGLYPIDGKRKDYSLPIFGDVMMQLRYMNVADVPDEALREKFVEANPPKTVIGEVAQNSSKGWQAQVMWGFEMINGKRYLTRNVSTRKDKEKVDARMVYDYQV